MAPSRKSIAKAHNDIPRSADFELLDIVRKRTLKALKTTVSSASKLTVEDMMTTLRTWKEELIDKWNDYKDAFEEHEAALVGAGELNQVEQITADYMSINSSFIKAKTHILAIMEEVHEESPSTVNSHSNPSTPYTMKLAPIRITPFSGNSSEWFEFKATCDAVLVNTLPEIQRLQQLKDALLGEPRSIVSQILPLTGSYDQAMKLLKEKYESTRAIVDGQLSKLYAIPTIDLPTAQAFRDMSNTINGLIATLNCCEIDTKSWDAILIFHVSRKFDSVTLSLWEEKLEGKKSVPKLKTLLEFLNIRITVLNSTEAHSLSLSTEKMVKPILKSPTQPQSKHQFHSKRLPDKAKVMFTLKSSYQCALCKGNHLPSRCTALFGMTLRDRHTLVNQSNLCVNCFYPHLVNNCPFEGACKKCPESHHTLLHPESKQMFLNVTDITNVNNEITDNTDESIETENSDTASEIGVHHFYHINDDYNDDDTLLATAIVPTRNKGLSVSLKALIDQGSTANLITIRACHSLRLKFNRLKTPMLGVGNSPVGNVIGRTVFHIGSTHDSSYELLIKAIVVQEIGESKGFDASHIREWSHLNSLKLADPRYFETSRIDLLLGGSAHADFILSEVKKGKRYQPIAQNSQLGWIISGNTNVESHHTAICRHLTYENVHNQDEELTQLLKSFWEIEEVKSTRIHTVEEQLAEEIFKTTITLDDNGKFVVDLPFKRNPFETLGDSFTMAKRRYAYTQKRHEKKPNIKAQYDSVLEEYLALNHMELVTDNPTKQYFLPHHAVVKETSTTTKLRVVFDASAKTSTGYSLNDCLCVGPVIQPELFDLLVRWRRFEFAMSADIEKMYRMMYVNRKHADFQTILWHRPGTSGILPYRLLTITFGTSSSPFQATRGVYEIGERIKKENPSLAKTIQTCFYVDDFLKSFDTIEEAKTTRIELTDQLSIYGFNLRQWKSNDIRTLDGLGENDKATCVTFDSTFKTLGIAWQSEFDSFTFKSVPINETKIWTKRKVLSAISKLFDPLGWLSPYIIRAKILMQNIWRDPIGIDWDLPLPEHLIDEWQFILKEIINPIEIKIPRWIKLSKSKQQVELHAFCDASNLSYACCVYIRTIDNNQVSCHLIAAKTRVAPVRAITIPRLELCGALLLANLTTRCIQALSITEFKLFTWCDSKIVLAWLATHPSKWVTFVANRVSEIQQNIDSNCWLYIPSKQNPADVASRGSSMAELKNNTMWWHGPSFLLDSSQFTPNQQLKLQIDNAPEKRKSTKINHLTALKENPLLLQFEDLRRLLHFTCLTFRWLKRKATHAHIHGPITAHEIQQAELLWIKMIQIQHFGHEIGRIKQNRPLPVNSNLLKLTPFLDKQGILRMNGRVKSLEHTQQNHSIILPANSKLTTLIIRDTHQHQALHGGVQLTLRTLRDRFWIIHARNNVNKLIGHCLVCYRTKKRLLQQQMSDLPSFRTQQARPFTFVGCDYAGPYQIKTNHLRNAPCEKGYIALFICLTTKAIHLELVGNQTTEEFVMALENFIARRGIPTEMYSDNASYFVSAELEINKLHDQWLSQTNALTRLLEHKRITFKRIPARASHMGGIWERAVGLVKYHLKRVMRDTKLTARKFDYVLKQIECCLNSRPLWALTPNADDIEVITPSHFFNFQPINSLPKPNLSHLKANQLDQYQYLYRLYTDFWKGWSKEYLDQLQPRAKWPEKQPNIQVGQIVVVSDDNIPPSRWPLGRVTALYPAKDGLVRVVDVKMRNTIKKRPIHRLGILPIIDNEKLNSSPQEQSNAGEDVVQI